MKANGEDSKSMGNGEREGFIHGDYGRFQNIVRLHSALNGIREPELRGPRNWPNFLQYNYEARSRSRGARLQTRNY